MRREGIKSIALAALTLLPALAMLLLAGILDAAAPAIAQNTTRSVGIIMYHSILDSTAKCGKYVVTPAQLESDLKWLCDNGYESVFISDLIDFVENGSLLFDMQTENVKKTGIKCDITKKCLNYAVFRQKIL